MGLCVLGPLSIVYGETAVADSAPALSAQVSGSGPSFFTAKTRLWNARSQIICFRLPQAATQDQSFTCQVDEKFLRVLVQPRVLTGEKIGYMRVQPLIEGKTRISIEGANLDVDIVRDPAFGTVAELNPRIVSPTSGTCVWGDFSVGMEQLTLGDPSQLPIPVLRLPNGHEVTGTVIPNQKISQYARWSFDLKAGDLNPGLNQLIAISKDASGHETRSNTVDINVVAPEESAIVSGLCADLNSGDRPFKTGPNPPRAVQDNLYGQGMILDNESAPWCFPIWVDKPGQYQMIVTMRGDISGDGLPTVSLNVDEEIQAAASARLATTEWRRVPLGHPVTLTEGGHILSVRIGNPFNQGHDDRRGLSLQKFELARLDGTPVKLASNAGDMMDSTLPAIPMAATPMMMQDPVPAGSNEFHVVFTDNLDGQTVASAVDFSGRCWWPNQAHTPPPSVELYVNKKLVSTQKSGAPHFTIDPASFVIGANSLQLRAILPSGRETSSQTLTVEVPPNFPLPAPAVTPSGNAVESKPSPDTVAPQVTIAYTPQSIAAGQTDVAIAHVMDNRHIAATDLVVDDQPQHLDQVPLHGLGPVVLPILTRDLKPGPHKLKVVVRDDAGNQASSPEASFTISGNAATTRSRYERAVFLLNRFGYGPEPGEIAEILLKGEGPWLESHLAQGVTTPGEANQQEWLLAQYGEPNQEGPVVSSAVQYLITAPNPVRARFLMWTENHFSTWIRKDGAGPKGQEHQDFLELGPASFFDLLFTSATSPAMLVYLDQRNSYSNKLNENYAREIMELHTLGVKGGYTQSDVTTLADLLTGWTLNDQAHEDASPGGALDRFFGYDSHLNSGKECRIFGLDFPSADPSQRFDRVLMALEMLSAHPSCATFISRKLCEDYVSDPAPPALVDALAKIYLETGGDMSAMLMEIPHHPEFWAAPVKVANAIDFGIRDARMARSANPGPASTLASKSGMGIFDRATPDGYPADDGYSVNSNALLQRWRFAKDIQNDFVRSGLIPASLRPADTAWTPEATQRLLDLAAFRITGNTLDAASNEAAQKLLADSQGTTDVRLHTLATFICQLPENSLK